MMIPPPKEPCLDDLWDRIERFNNEHFPDWKRTDLRFHSNALAGEVGELCDATKHLYGGGTNPDYVNKETPEHLLEEAFDAFVYIVLLIGAMGKSRTSFFKAGENKIDILYDRMERIKRRAGKL